ncbi:hypothetical protein SAMN04488522_11083 [Pedobacter caeni]|uniref:Uncharacterized protein n=1 Tax=Pedobacter caeni TaxID=288992 RepID=A0A1M5PT22_9SPHI|nr:hypothetical protein SAMN04488522_11083 [Pedobacter caeni]
MKNSGKVFHAIIFVPILRCIRMGAKMYETKPYNVSEKWEARHAI